jgi:ribosomal protein L28
VKEGALIMAKKLTSRKPLFGNLRSHSCRATKTRQNLNLQTKTVDGVKVTLTNREWKTMKKAA